MKHTIKITLLLVLLFLAAQLIGLAIVRQYLNVRQYQLIDPLTNLTITVTNVTYSALPYGIERPPLKETTSFIYILAAILIGTVILLLIMKFRKTVLWKFWFYFAVVLCLSIALAPFIKPMPAFVLSIILGYYKIFSPRLIVHNITELFLYGGLAAIFVPVMNLASVLILLAAISAYDIIAVWYSKHMVMMAKYQTSAKVFAGMILPYKGLKARKPAGKLRKIRVQTAILGGGDIGFPLIFAGVVMKSLLAQNPVLGFYKALAIPFFASIALLFLLLKSEKGKFYPAMPFLAIGCVAGWLIILSV